MTTEELKVVATACSCGVTSVANDDIHNPSHQNNKAQAAATTWDLIDQQRKENIEYQPRRTHTCSVAVWLTTLAAVGHTTAEADEGGHYHAHGHACSA